MMSSFHVRLKYYTFLDFIESGVNVSVCWAMLVSPCNFESDVYMNVQVYASFINPV